MGNISLKEFKEMESLNDILNEDLMKYHNMLQLISGNISTIVSSMSLLIPLLNKTYTALKPKLQEELQKLSKEEFAQIKNDYVSLEDVRFKEIPTKFSVINSKEFVTNLGISFNTISNVFYKSEDNQVDKVLDMFHSLNEMNLIIHQAFGEYFRYVKQIKPLMLEQELLKLID